MRVHVVADAEVEVAVQAEVQPAAGVPRLVGQAPRGHLQQDLLAGPVDLRALADGQPGQPVDEVVRVGVVVAGRRVVDVEVAVVGEVGVQRDAQQAVLTTGVDRDGDRGGCALGARVIDPDLAADQLGVEHPAVRGDVHGVRGAGVLVQRHALEPLPHGRATVSLDHAGRPLHAADDVLHQPRLAGVVRAEVAHAGHPGPAAVVRLAPRDRVVVAHGVAARVVRRLVHRGEHVGVTADVERVVVPLVGALPPLRQVAGRRVGAVLHPDRARLAGAAAGVGVPGHQAADHVVPPRVAAAHVGRVVNGDDAVAGLHVPFHRRLLVGGPRVAGGLEHHQGVEVRQVLVVEDRRVLGVLRGDPRLGEGGLQDGNALFDRLGMAELSGLGEDQYVGLAVLAVVGCGRRWTDHEHRERGGERRREPPSPPGTPGHVHGAVPPYHVRN